jgi:hypothetical protein
VVSCEDRHQGISEERQSPPGALGIMHGTHAPGGPGPSGKPPGQLPRDEPSSLPPCHPTESAQHKKIAEKKIPGENKISWRVILTPVDSLRGSKGITVSGALQRDSRLRAMTTKDMSVRHRTPRTATAARCNDPRRVVRPPPHTVYGHGQCATVVTARRSRTRCRSSSPCATGSTSAPVNPVLGLPERRSRTWAQLPPTLPSRGRYQRHAPAHRSLTLH